MQKNWDEMTDEERRDSLQNALAGFATKQSLAEVLAHIQELQGAISRLEKRVNALENRPAVGS